jgi:hypothetical protein
MCFFFFKGFNHLIAMRLILEVLIRQKDAEYTNVDEAMSPYTPAQTTKPLGGT